MRGHHTGVNGFLMHYPHESDPLQLELVLDDVRLKCAWPGTSPRDLTRVNVGLFLKRKRKKSMRDFVRDENQLEFWPAKKRRRRIYGGAPLLLPFPEE